MLKISMRFVHMLTVIKISVLSCVLHISKFCVVLKPCSVCKKFNTLKNVLSGGTDGYFKAHRPPPYSFTFKSC